VSICRAIGPALCGGLFGWSASSGLSYPLNSHLMFILISLMGIGCLLIMFFGLGENINKSRKDEDLDYTSTLYTPLLPRTAWSPKDETKPVIKGYK